MKTNQAEQQSAQTAREPLARRAGLAILKTRPVRRQPQANCVTPARPALRTHAADRHTALTRIVAKADVGFGNTLFIRGEGAGLSWDIGQPLQCIENSTWVWSGTRESEPVTFKLLINDQLWCCGANLTAAPGVQTEVVPVW